MKRFLYDKSWKMLIENLVQDFIAFFLPDIYKKIDFSKGITFMDQELQEIILELEEKGTMLSDKLSSFPNSV